MATPSRGTGRLAFLIACVSALAISSQHVFASTTWTVRKDGTGQFTTINAAKAAAASGDVIEVGPGTYPEEIDFSYAVTLQSTAGAATTILDGEHIRRILIFRAGTGSVVDGFTIRNGTQPSSGGGLRVQLGATATVRNCVFEGNHSDFDGGAIITRDPGTLLDMLDCTIRNNTADRHAAGALVIGSSVANFTRCRFEGNIGVASGAAAMDDNAVFTATDCLFLRNEADFSGVFATISTVNVQGCTFQDNVSEYYTIYTSGVATTFKRNILAGDTNAFAYFASVGSENRSCNVYWLNGGSVAGGTLHPDEVEMDPLFCDPAHDVLTISTNSPAAPAHSACGLLIGAFPTDCGIIGPPPVTHAPNILTILDVPNDQGRQVRVRWEKSDYDAANKPVTITGYAIYRAQGAFMMAKLASAPRHVSGGKVMIDGWDYVATVPARGDDIYQYVAPTLCDKPKDSDPCWSTFFVSALTPAPLTYFDSEPDSGWSEDNLAPDPPAAFAVNFSASGAQLVWEPSRAKDVDHYRIYKAKGGWPLPIAHNLVQTTAGTEWVDLNGVAPTHYIITAVDVNGNEGDAIEPETTGGQEGPIPQEFSLRQNSPNPFNPITRIQFDVPAEGGLVTIAIYDVAGRRVRNLLNESRPGGSWSVVWDGTAESGKQVSSGVYFCKMTAGRFTETRRMVMLK
jgi:hypothetical protein